ncbi:hypothetical protein ACIQVT_14490 [Streptomyces sp. NPDC100445]|uniref:hypothetical protein n=1 Tax=Streptomyces sp. NPDC100445 TaxID=3366102 RepID=UPI00381185B0
MMIFFRDEFRKLLRRLKSAKGGGAAVEFSEEVQAVAEEARAAVEAEVRDTSERVQEVRAAFEASQQAARAAADAASEPGTLAENGAPPSDQGEPSYLDPSADQRGLRAEQMAQQGITLVNAMQAELEQLLQSVLPSPAAPMDALRSMAREHPEAAIMAAYREVDMRMESLVRKVIRAARARGETVERPRMPRSQLMFLVASGLPADVADVITGLSRLRNEVTHGGSVQSSAAIDYISACAAALNLLSLYERRLIPPDEGQPSPLP